MARKAKAFEGKETPEEEAKEHGTSVETARKMMRKHGRSSKRMSHRK